MPERPRATTSTTMRGDRRSAPRGAARATRLHGRDSGFPSGGRPGHRSRAEVMLPASACRACDRRAQGLRHHEISARVLAAWSCHDAAPCRHRHDGTCAASSPVSLLPVEAVMTKNQRTSRPTISWQGAAIRDMKITLSSSAKQRPVGSCLPRFPPRRVVNVSSFRGSRSESPESRELDAFTKRRFGFSPRRARMTRWR